VPRRAHGGIDIRFTAIRDLRQNFAVDRAHAIEGARAVCIAIPAADECAPFDRERCGFLLPISQCHLVHHYSLCRPELAL
jgi:hypothetical protein